MGVAQAIAAYLGVPVAEVLAWHEEGFGYGEIVFAYSMAEESGRRAAELFQMRRDGLGWGAIAKLLGLELGNSERHLGLIMGDRRLPEPTQTASPVPTPTGTVLPTATPTAGAQQGRPSLPGPGPGQGPRGPR